MRRSRRKTVPGQLSLLPDVAFCRTCGRKLEGELSVKRCYGRACWKKRERLKQRKRIRKLREHKPTDRGVRQTTKGKGMSNIDDPVELWQAYVASNDDDTLRNQLVLHYQPLLEKLAYDMQAKLTSSVSVLDLRQDGVLGLISAIQKFKPSLGNKFITYCPRRIIGAMLDRLRTTDWIPRLARQRAKEMQKLRIEAIKRQGGPVADDQIAEVLGLDFDETRKLIIDSEIINVASMNHDRTLENSRGGSLEFNISGFFADSKVVPADQRQQQIDLLRLVTKGLSKNERLVIILYYYEDLTMKEIGQTLGLSESRVSQMHSALVARLREKLKDRKAEFVG